VRLFGVTSMEKAQRDEETCGFRPAKWKPPRLSPSAVKRASEVVVLDAVATGRVRHANMGSCAAAGIRYRAALRASEGRLSRRGRGVGRAETRATARAFPRAKPSIDDYS
jgi:hypothetical protein